jgi:hypothetical protein
VHVSPRRRSRRGTGRLRVAARGADSGDQHLDGFLRRRERVVDWGRRRIEDRWGRKKEKVRGGVRGVLPRTPRCHFPLLYFVSKYSFFFCYTTETLYCFKRTQQKQTIVIRSTKNNQCTIFMQNIHQ